MRNSVQINSKYFFLWLLVFVMNYLGTAYAESPKETVQRLVQEEEKTGDVQQVPIIGAEGMQDRADEHPIQEKPLVSGRYFIHENGTVTDTRQKLMWKRCAEGTSGEYCSDGKAVKYIWDSAMYKFGKNSGYSFASYDDWRLPTKNELRTLVYCSNGVKQEIAWNNNCTNNGESKGYKIPTIDQQAFPNTGSQYPVFFWSSTQAEDNKKRAWYVSFSSGFDDKGDKGRILQVRLVRKIE